MHSSTQYWTKVFRCVIAVSLFLSERSLALRGGKEILRSPHNGKCLGLSELLAKYVSFLKEHIEKYRNCGSGKTNYLCSTIYEEAIQEL